MARWTSIASARTRLLRKAQAAHTAFTSIFLSSLNRSEASVSSATCALRSQAARAHICTRTVPVFRTH
jgi:hypothetical protein